MTKSIYKQCVMAASVLIALSSCGKQTFDVVQSQQDSNAPGSTSIAPKVDILLAVDDTGSTAGLQGELQTSIRSFMTELQAQGWDFRVAVVPLTAPASITAIATSKFDPHWNSQWVAPYPGATMNTVPSVPAYWVPTDQLSVAVPLNSLAGGVEPGLTNVGNVLNLASTKSNFLRDDAILATVILSNGEDAYTYCPPYATNCSPTPTVQSLVDRIKSAKGSALSGTVRLYSVVNTYGYRVTNCRLADDGISNAGARYMQAASSTQGQSYNICTTPLSSVLAGIKTNLTTIQLPFIKNNLLLASRPNEATIRVYKKLSNGSQIEVPKSSNGSPGWTYLGYLNNVPMISAPVAADFRSGYIIQLSDAYKLSGNESASVTFLPYGVQPSN